MKRDSPSPAVPKKNKVCRKNPTLNSRVASPMLQDWNSRRQFTPPSDFHADGVNAFFISQLISDGSFLFFVSVPLINHRVVLNNFRDAK
ncbi:hypothetical protein QYF36_014790 [Acer negundo]|nr:hypothetical protein QYF36_014790 [Acer negundo]